MTVIDKDNIVLNVELHATKGNRLVLVIAANAVQFWLTSDKDATTGIKVDEHQAQAILAMRAALRL